MVKHIILIIAAIAAICLMAYCFEYAEAQGLDFIKDEAKIKSKNESLYYIATIALDPFSGKRVPAMQNFLTLQQAVDFCGQWYFETCWVFRVDYVKGIKVHTNAEGKRSFSLGEDE